MGSLRKYTGNWNDRLTAHLFRRTTYGVNLETIRSFGSKSLDECITALFTPMGPPPPPININYADDPDVPIGETWVDKAVSANVNPYRTASLRGWSFELMLKGGPNIREKMTMFWHNHFVTADINDPRFSYKYIALLRSFALGNFKQLTKEVTIDPAMLNYLNGRDNTRQAPNENYARELMELFTLGKGDLSGPGDYTTYTELDVKEVARALTGWIDVRNNLPIRSQYQVARHDITSKQLSHRFGNAVIANAGAEEYKNIIDLIFKKEEVALFLARKFYRWFVHSHIDATTEEEIIKPLADILRSSNYEVEPALRALLSSEHFFDNCIIGGMVKNPVDFLLNPLNQCNVIYPADLATQYRVYVALYQTSFNMQMAMYQAPSVAGWQPYYQEPSYYRLWLNATSLPSRKTYTDVIASAGITLGSYRLALNQINMLNAMKDPSNVDQVVDDFSLVFFCKPLAANQLAVLRPLLLGGTNVNGWTVAYNNFKANPQNEAARNVVVNRLRTLVVYMMRMPEYHLS